MNIKGTNVIGLKIINLNEGRNIGRVEDLIFDPNQRKILAVLVDKGGIFSEARIIETKDIKSIGKDAVIVNGNNIIKKVSETDSKIAEIAKNDTYVTRSRVITQDGTELGAISDIIFDTETGVVIGMELSQGLKDISSGKKQINYDDIVTIGKEVILVKSQAQNRIDEQSSRQGLSGFVNQGKETGETTVENAADSIKDTLDKAKNNVEETVNRPENQQMVSGAKSEVNRIIEEAGSDVKSLSDEAKTRLDEVKSKIESKRQQRAVGKYLTVNILSPQDDIIAKRGDMVTNSLIEKSKELGILDQVINNVSENPVV